MKSYRKKIHNFVIHNVSAIKIFVQVYVMVKFCRQKPYKHDVSFICLLELSVQKPLLDM